jgi:hypothetical protein
LADRALAVGREDQAVDAAAKVAAGAVQAVPVADVGQVAGAVAVPVARAGGAGLAGLEAVPEAATAVPR